jgi:hypothetical protein
MSFIIPRVPILISLSWLYHPSFVLLVLSFLSCLNCSVLCSTLSFYRIHDLVLRLTKPNRYYWGSRLIGPALFQKQTNTKHKRRMSAHTHTNTQEQNNIYLPLPTPSLMHTSRSNTPSPTQSETNNQNVRGGKTNVREGKRYVRGMWMERNLHKREKDVSWPMAMTVIKLLLGLSLHHLDTDSLKLHI